jgi:outer membrane murein-binding lipoprotein Lpp
MSTTMKASKSARRAARDTTWRQAREPGKMVITIQPDDPFQSLLMPSYEPGPLPSRKNYAFASAPIKPNTRPQVFSEPVSPNFAEPQPQSVLEREYVAREDYRAAKSNARDAWTAVALMGLFIAGGTYWTFDRIGTDGTKIQELTTKVDDLNNQIDNERGVVMTRNSQIQQLNEQLREAKKK